MSQRKPTLKPRNVHGAKYLGQIIDLLLPLHAHRPAPKRNLHYDELCTWLLLYFFSSILTSLRGLQQASLLDQLRRKLRLPRFSLGRFTESAAVFDPELLVPIIEQIGGRLEDIEIDSGVSLHATGSGGLRLYCTRHFVFITPEPPRLLIRYPLANPVLPN